MTRQRVVAEPASSGATARDRHRRIVVSRRGGPEVLELVEEPVPEPGPGRVRVRMLAAGVSAFDVMVRSARFPGFPRLPFTPGVDFVGEVDRLGSGVSGFEIGQLVAAGTAGLDSGGYAEFVCAPAGVLVPVPAGVDPVEVVCLVANYVTAHVAMHDTAHVSEGDRVLVQGAAGGVGTALLELGRLAGLRMYGTASPYNHDVVASFGAVPIDYHTEDVVARVRALTGDGVDVVFDPIGGGRQLWRSYRALRRGGRLVWFGVAATSRRGMGVIPASLVTRLALSLLPDGRRAPLMANAGKFIDGERLTPLMDLLARGELHPVVTGRIPLEEAARAHEQLEHGRHAGKLVLVSRAYSRGTSD